MKAIKETNWLKWAGLEGQESGKDKLIKQAQSLGVSIFSESKNETTHGIYAEFRGVESEIEIKRRLDDKKKMILSATGLGIGMVSIFISLAALVRGFMR